MSSAARRRPSLREQAPDPGRFWIRYTPRAWPGPPGPWVDLGQARVGRSRGGDDGPLAARLPADPLDDLLYLPPVARAREAERRRLAAAAAATGSPVLLQLEPGQEPAEKPALGVYDLLSALLAGETAALAELPAGATAAWPLIPGVTDRDRLVAAGLGALAAAGVGPVRGLALELTPAERRRLAEGADAAAFAALFHGAGASERRFARAVAAHGLEPFLERPAAGAGDRLAGNRRAAAELGAAADLWLRLGRSAGSGQALLRAARWADRESHDLEALEREGNLRLVDWLDDRGREVVTELFARGRSRLLEELRAEYLGGGGEDAVVG